MTNNHQLRSENNLCTLQPPFDDTGLRAMKVTYTTQQIVEVSGLPRRTVQHWTAQDVLIANDKGPGSGVQHRYERCELEIAKLLGEVNKRQVRSDELARLAAMFRTVMKLPETGFLSVRPELLQHAERMIAGDGPALWGMSGSGMGVRGPTEEQRKRKDEWLARTKMTPEQSGQFWAYVAYGLAIHKKLPTTWLVWFGVGDEISMHARLPSPEPRKTDHGTWQFYAESEHPSRGSGIIIDLLVLVDA